MQDIKEKQDYLYHQIIEQNYDPEEFQQVMEKNKGLTLQNYTLQELKNVVIAFKNHQNSLITEPSELHPQKILPKTSQVDKGSGKKLKQEQPQQNLPEIIPQLDHLKRSFNSSNKVFRQFIKKSEVSDLYTRIHNQKQNIKILVRSYTKKQQQGFFGATYIAYLIECPQLEWKVHRRYKDFQWLQSKLCQLLPGYPIPPIPKKTKMRSFDENHIEQRMIVFQQYLNKLLQIPQICSQPIVQQFLRCENELQYTSAKQNFQDHLQHIGARVSTLKGEDIINKQHYKVCSDQLSYFKGYRDILKNLNYASNKLLNSLKQASQQALEVSACFNDLYSYLGKKQSIKGSQTVDLLSEFTCDLGYKLESQGLFIKTQVFNYWSYEEKNIQNIVASMNKLSKEQNDTLKKYKNLSNVNIESENNLQGQQGKLFNEYLQSRQFFRLKLSFLQQQIERHCLQSLPIYTKQWTQGLKKYLNQVKQQILIGADQLTKAICICEGKKLQQVQYISNRPVKKFSRGSKEENAIKQQQK